MPEKQAPAALQTKLVKECSLHLWPLVLVEASVSNKFETGPFQTGSYLNGHEAVRLIPSGHSALRANADGTLKQPLLPSTEH